MKNLCYLQVYCVTQWNIGYFSLGHFQCMDWILLTTLRISYDALENVGSWTSTRQTYMVAARQAPDVHLLLSPWTSDHTSCILCSTCRYNGDIGTLQSPLKSLCEGDIYSIRHDKTAVL